MYLLLWVALLPPIYLLHLVYKQDKIEKEPKSLVIRTLFFGILSIIPAMILEVILEAVMYGVFGYDSDSTSNYLVLILIENIFCVGLVEECCKYLAARTIWKNKAFNYRFDAVVYAVSSALGFAALENVLYVFDNGLATGLMRAVLSIPLHGICGIFMGIYMGQAKLCECRDDRKGKKAFLRRAIWVPTFIHGIYDALASLSSSGGFLLFLAFVIVVDVIAVKRIKAESASDEPIYPFSSYENGDYWHTQSPQ